MREFHILEHIHEHILADFKQIEDALRFKALTAPLADLYDCL